MQLKLEPLKLQILHNHFRLLLQNKRMFQEERLMMIHCTKIFQNKKKKRWLFMTEIAKTNNTKKTYYSVQEWLSEIFKSVMEDYS